MVKIEVKLSLLLLLLYVFVISASQDHQQGKDWESWVVGNKTSQPSQRSPNYGAVLMGGGEDQAEAFKWMVKRSGAGNFLVLRAKGDDAYNSWILDMGPMSVETLIVTSRDGANDPYVVETVKRADAIWLAGGDQANYWNWWHGTGLGDALKDVLARNVPIGGTSAGMAVLGEFGFMALGDSDLTPEAALADPYDPRVTIKQGFLKLPHLSGVITEPHFFQRNRMGRVFTYLARMLEDKLTQVARAIAADEATALIVDFGGIATVVGDGYVYLFEAKGRPEWCKPGNPLTITGIRTMRLQAGDTFDLNLWKSTEGVEYTIDVVKGQYTSKGGSVY